MQSHGDVKPAAHLDVDVVFTVLDHMHIGVVNGLFMVLYTGGPIRSRAQHLTQRRHRDTLLTVFL